MYVNQYTGTKNRYWLYCGYTHVLVPKGYIDIGLVLMRIVSKKPMHLTNIRQQAYQFEYLTTTALDVALSQ